jgi:hypothetical protein
MLRSTLLLAGLLAWTGSLAHAQSYYDGPPDLGIDMKIDSPANDPPPPISTLSPPAPAAPRVPQGAINPFNQSTGQFPPVPLPRRAQNVVDIYAGATSQRVLAQMEQRPSSGRTPSAPSAAPPVRARGANKPHQNLTTSPTLSPYMNLFREENAVDLPNYHTLVRPALEQQQINRANQAELMRLGRQVQAMPYGTQSTAMRGGLPSTGHSSRYFNTSGYFPTNSMR